MDFRPPYRPDAAPLDEDEFWTFWESARADAGGDLFAMYEAFEDRVTAPDDHAIQALQARFIEVTGRLHTWPHRAAIQSRLGECDEHDFVFFGAFVVAHGRGVLERVAADPDALADVALSGPPRVEHHQWTFGTELPHYARTLGESFGGMVMHRRRGWADDNFDRSNPAWAPLAPPEGTPASKAAAWRSVNQGPAVESAEANAELLLEIWVPTAGLGPDDVEPLLHAVDRFLGAQEHGLSAEQFDDDEEIEDHFVFSVWRAPESELIEVACRVAALPRVPAGTYALVTTVGQQLSGDGRRVDLGA